MPDFRKLASTGYTLGMYTTSAYTLFMLRTERPDTPNRTTSNLHTLKMFLIDSWVMPALRLAVVGGVLIATHFSFQSNLLAALAVLLAWGVVVVGVLDETSRNMNDTTEQMVLIALCVRTYSVLYYHSEAAYDAPWIVPMVATVVYNGLHKEGKEDNPSSTLAATLVLGAGVGLYMLTGNVFDTMECTVGAALAMGGGEGAMAWMFLQLTAVLLDTDLNVGILRVALVCLLLVSLAARGNRGIITELRERVGNVIWRVVTNTLPYQMVVLVSAAVILQSWSQTWYASAVTFPSPMRDVCDGLLEVVGVVRVVYEFTSDPDFQDSLLPTLPELAQIRSIIYRLVLPTYKPLVDCRDGKHAFYSPGSDILANLLLVPLVVCAGAIVLQVFETGSSYVRSRLFWGASLVLGVLFTAVTQLTTDMPVVMWYAVFEGSDLARVYTPMGQYAFIASITFCAACLVLFALEGVKQEQGNESLLSFVLYGVTAPSFVILAGASFALVVVWGSSGAPIETPVVYQRPSGKPDWLISTPMDKAVALGADKLIQLMQQMAGREFVIAAALVKYALEKLGTWGCLCLDDIIGGFGSIKSGITSFFGGRRRLLEHRLDSTTYGTYAVARRRLLGGGCDTIEVCVSDVVKNIINELTNLGKMGLKYAIGLGCKLIHDLLPFAKEIDEALGIFGRLDDLVDFVADLSIRIQKISFQPHIPLPTIRLPSLPTPRLSSSLIVVAILAVLASLLLWRLGIMRPIVVAARSSIALIVLAAVVSTLSVLLVSMFQLRAELRAEGYDVQITFRDNVYAYAACVGAMLMGMLLACGDAPKQAYDLIAQAETSTSRADGKKR